MANEIQISAVHGLTISLQLYNGVASFGSPIAATEIGSTGDFVATVPNGTPFGRYTVIAMAGDIKIASGQLLWDGNYEFLQGLVTIQGLDPNNPSTTTPTNWDAGDIHIEISGDGVSSTEMQRV